LQRRCPRTGDRTNSTPAPRQSFAADLSRPLWRISVTPTKGADVVAAIAGAVDGVRVIYDWAGGLIWLELADGHTVHDARIREAVVAHGGGHATLIRADATARAAIAPFQPQPAALAALSAKLKAEFDPVGILNPGRMWAGV